MTPYQHGFRKKRSCETQLALAVQDLAKGLDDGEQLDVILLDFAKAFDKVNHRRLLMKLYHYGVKGNTLEWIRSFLSDRKQQVVLDGSTSSQTDVTSGVPQGTVLGPLLFLVYINDLPDHATSTSRLFADDCILYRRVRCAADAEALQADLDNFQTWESDWLMEFHPSKCQILRVTNKRNPVRATYRIHGHVLEEVSSAKYLGVNLDSKLTWNHHVHSTALKANGARAFLQRNLRKAPKHVKAACYTALVRPVMEYASSVWSPNSIKSTNELEMVQRRAARHTMSDFKRTTSVTPMLTELGWDTLAERRAKSKVTLLYRMMHNLVAVNPLEYLHHPQVMTRGHPQVFRQPYCRTKVYQMSYFPSAAVLWNSLPASIVGAASVEAFRTQIATHTLL